MKTTLSRYKYGSLKLMVGAGLMMLNFVSEANAVINCKLQCNSSTKCGKDAKLAAQCLKECPKSRCSTVPHANSPIGKPMDVKKVENPFNTRDSSQKVLQAVIEAPCEMKHKIISLAPFSLQEKTFLLMGCSSSEPTETEWASAEPTPKTPKPSSRISSSSHRKSRTAEPSTTNMREEAGKSLQQPNSSPPPSHLPPDYYTETPEGRAEAEAEAEASQQQGSGHNLLAQLQQGQRNLHKGASNQEPTYRIEDMSDMEKTMLNRSIAIGPEQLKKDLEAELNKAKVSQNKMNIAKYTAQLAYVESKIGDDENW